MAKQTRKVGQSALSDDALAKIAATQQEAELPKMSRERARRDNPFTDAVRETYEEGTGRELSVPAQNMRQIIYLLRQAAADNGLGVRIVMYDRHENVVKQNKAGFDSLSGTCWLQYQGKARKARKSTTE